MLVLFALLAFVLLMVYVIAAYQSRSPQVLYEQLFENARDFLYDPDKLPDWEQWNSAYTRTKGNALAAANEMFKPLNDPYTIVVGPELQDGGIEFECAHCVGVGILIATAYENNTEESCRVQSERTGVSCKYPTIVSVIYNSPAAHAHLRAGDSITKINDWPTAGESIASVLKRMHGNNRSKITLTVERDGIATDHELNRQFINAPSCYSRMLDDDIGYLRISNFNFWSESYAVGQAETLAKARAIVVDVRDNPGGEVFKGIRLAALFIREGHIVTTHVRIPGTKEYVWTTYSFKKGELVEDVEGVVRDTMTGNLPAPMFAGKPIIVLTNENTASAAELFTGALRDTGQAVVLGGKTFGKGVMQSILGFPRSVVLRVTSGKYYLPSGFWPGDGARYRNGIEPDITIPPQSRLFDFGSDQDKQLAAAVRHLSEKL
ncbi:MAG TPA: S41 family peptidase [Candidatus Obscuribacterales bacterium]